MDWISDGLFHRSMKRFRSLAHYVTSKAIPNSNAPVLTYGGTVVQVPVVGVIGRETRGGALQGELCSPRVKSRLMNLRADQVPKFMQPLSIVPSLSLNEARQPASAIQPESEIKSRYSS